MIIRPYTARASLPDRLGLARGRVRGGRWAFVRHPRDIAILPASGPPPYPTILALHGMGMRAEVFARWLADLLDEPWAFWIPEGPYPFERHVGGLRSVGHAWYLWDGDTPSFRRSLRRSEHRLLRLLPERAEAWGLDPENVVVLGFSQGGYFGGSLALRHAERFRGLAVAGARVRPGYSGRPLAEIPRIPILFLHGRDDAVVSAVQAEASARELEQQGFPIRWTEVDGDHRWNGAMSDAFRVWAREIFAATR